MADLGILFRIKADSDQAKREISSLRGLVSKEIGGISNDFASAVPGVGRFAGALGPVGVGLVATAALAIGAGVAIFGLAKAASDAGSKIFDLSRNTGISAETLSALKVAADQSGSSIEEVAGGLTIFNRLLGQAADGSKQAAATLKRFGIDAKTGVEDSREALAKVIKTINELPPGAERAIAAQKAFGRSGANLVSTLESVGGNLDEFIEKAKALGVVFDEEASVAADEFGDKLTQLETRITGIAYTIANKAIPEILLGLNSLDAGLAQNQNSWANWAGDVARAAVAAGNAFASAAAGAARFGIQGIGPGIMFSLAESSDAQYRRSAGLDKPPAVVAPPPVRPRGGGGGKKGGGAKAAVVDSNQLEITRQETERFYKEQEEIVQRSYERQLRTVEEFTDEQVQLELNRSAALKALLIEERSAITEKGEARLNKERTINEEIAALEQQTQRTIIQIRDKGAEEAEEIEKARAEKFEAARQAADDLRISRIQNAIKERQLLESTGEKEITDIRAAALQRRVELLEMELSKFRSGSAEYLKIQGDIAAAESERVGIIEDGVQRAIDARRREVEDMLRNAEAQRDARLRDEREDPTSGRSMFGDVFADLKEGGASDIVAFGGMVKSVLSDLSDSAGNFGTIMTSVFGGVAQAVGNAVKAFVLLGGAGGGARKFAAEIIASVAQMATVKAVFELAEALAALARAFFGDPKAGAEAALHFKAAAQYGIVAGIAAIAGRAVAGNSFQQGGGGAGAPTGGATPSRGSSTAPTQGTPISEGRAGQGAPVTLNINVTRDAGSIVEVVAGDIQSDGKLRTIIRRDFGFAGT